MARNQIIDQLPFAVTKHDLTEARFASISDAKGFVEWVTTKYSYSEGTWKIVFQYYNDHGALMGHEWGSSLKAA